MAFFLETLLGGLMAGMLYSLVALGFVLIFKASGVFNFAQGAMVLFAALAMARFSEFMPLWLDINSLLLSNLIAFVMAAVVMFAVAWAIERLVLRHLVNQEGATLLMATLGITYFMEGLGQSIFGSDIYKIDIGMPKEPIFVLSSLFEGGVLVNLRGERFMDAVHPRGSLAPRDIVARAIHRELAASGDPHVCLDLGGLERDFIRRRFPGVHAKCLGHGVDITREPIPVVPAAHFLCGGIQIGRAHV